MKTDMISKVVSSIGSVDVEFFESAQRRLDSLTKPQGSLGRLEELARTIVAIKADEKPRLANKVIFTLAGDHGVAEEGVSAYPKEVTAQMVINFLHGGAGINVLARHIGARVVVVDMGVAERIKNLKVKSENFRDKKINFGTRNMLKGPAMTRREAEESIERGMEIFFEEEKCGIDIIGTGDMGIGNTTASSAIASILTGSTVEEVTGRGTGLNEMGLEHKINVIKEAVSVNRPDPRDPIDVLSKVGGFEIGGLAGIILASSSKKVPVVIDGFISGAAALIAFHIEPKVRDYMIASHCSVERGHRIILRHMGLNPLVDFNLRLGEGTGSAIGINMADMAVKILTEMASFSEANVSERIKDERVPVGS